MADQLLEDQPLHRDLDAGSRRGLQLIGDIIAHERAIVIKALSPQLMAGVAEHKRRLRVHVECKRDRTLVFVRPRVSHQCVPTSTPGLGSSL